eukprot:PITA_23648
MYTDHSALKYLVNKPVLGEKICIWLLLFREYDFEVIVKLGRLNARLDHLSCIETGGESTNLEEGLPDVQLFMVRVADNKFSDIIHFLTRGTTPEGYTIQQKKELVPPGKKMGARYIITVTKYLTRWVEAQPVKDCLGETTSKFLFEYVLTRFRFPKILMSDRGTHFLNETINVLTEEFQVYHQKSTPYHLHANGTVEAFNKIL